MVLKKMCFYSIIFSLILGTLLHFVYDWFGKSSIVGVFGAVNESTWEHLKLIFWPGLLFSVFEYFYLGYKYNNYVTAKAIQLFLGVFLIIAIFYTYTGILGKNYFVLDILTFIVSVIISHCVGYKLMESSYRFSLTINYLSMVAIVILMTLFVIFTFNPPEIPLFKDPLTGTYGI